MTTFWSQYQDACNPNTENVPSWQRFTASGGVWMELKGCVTSEAGTQPPAACSAAGDSYVTLAMARHFADHRVFYRGMVTGSCGWCPS
jgi:hypothetical protein